MSDELVRELMTRNVTLIRRDGDLRELEKVLLRRGVHGVPVVDEVGRIVGVVSQTDLLAWHFQTERVEDPKGWSPRTPAGVGCDARQERHARVSEVMSPLVHCIGPDKTVSEAAARMVRERVHRLVVVDRSYAVLGILSATDLLRAVPGVDQLLDTPPKIVATGR